MEFHFSQNSSESHCEALSSSQPSSQLSNSLYIPSSQQDNIFLQSDSLSSNSTLPISILPSSSQSKILENHPNDYFNDFSRRDIGLIRQNSSKIVNQNSNRFSMFSSQPKSDCTSSNSSTLPISNSQQSNAFQSDWLSKNLQKNSQKFSTPKSTISTAPTKPQLSSQNLYHRNASIFAGSRKLGRFSSEEIQNRQQLHSALEDQSKDIKELSSLYMDGISHLNDQMNRLLANQNEIKENSKIPNFEALLKENCKSQEIIMAMNDIKNHLNLLITSERSRSDFERQKTNYETSKLFSHSQMLQSIQERLNDIFVGLSNETKGSKQEKDEKIQKIEFLISQQLETLSSKMDQNFGSLSNDVTQSRSEVINSIKDSQIENLKNFEKIENKICKNSHENLVNSIEMKLNTELKHEEEIRSGFERIFEVLQKFSKQNEELILKRNQQEQQQTIKNDHFDDSKSIKNVYNVKFDHLDEKNFASNFKLKNQVDLYRTLESFNPSLNMDIGSSDVKDIDEQVQNCWFGNAGELIDVFEDNETFDISNEPLVQSHAQEDHLIDSDNHQLDQLNQSVESESKLSFEPKINKLEFETSKSSTRSTKPNNIKIKRRRMRSTRSTRSTRSNNLVMKKLGLFDQVSADLLKQPVLTRHMRNVVSLPLVTPTMFSWVPEMNNIKTSIKTTKNQ